MSPSDFSKLTPEHQYLLQLAKEQHGLEVIPLQELKGGQTGAFLYLASVSARNARQVQHFIIKFDHINEKAKPGETERHRLAASQAPSGFSKQNMPVLAYEFEHEGATALFYTLAGQSLQRFRTLASQERQNRLEALFAATNDYLLREWNNGSTFERALHPQKLLQMWLGYRLKPDGQVASFLRDKFRIDPHTEGFLIQGQVFPNPLSYGLDAERWKETRPIDVLTGFQHGDLNTGNILAKFAEDSKDLEGYFLIDFALYKDQMPLLYDQCYLEMSYLILELDHAPFQKWVSFVNHISVRDMPDPKEVPVELSGTCAVINAGRKSFERWMLETHPSLSDDLWGQFWLAGVAAGLNFCNKVGLSTEARLAGLIYSTAQLKRYCIQFGIPLPSDVCLLYDASKWVEMAPINKFTSASYIHHNNLPLQPTPFIGREAELSTLTNFLSDPKVRLVTIVGPGGMGKTRLALATAKRMLDGIQFPDGVFFVNLAPLSESNQIGSVVAEALNFRLQGEDGRSSQEKILDYLQDKQLLLLFDNCEHILDGMDLVAGILRAAPEVKILATSRERLQLRAEQVYLLEGLEFPDWETPEDAADYTAVRLFLQSARRNRPSLLCRIVTI